MLQVYEIIKSVYKKTSPNLFKSSEPLTWLTTPPRPWIVPCVQLSVSPLNALSQNSPNL